MHTSSLVTCPKGAAQPLRLAYDAGLAHVRHGAAMTGMTCTCSSQGCRKRIRKLMPTQLTLGAGTTRQWASAVLR